MWTRMMMWLMGRGDEASCAQMAEHLDAYLDGQVDPVLLGRLEKHLQACRRCGLEVSTFQEIKASLARGGAKPDPAAVRRLTEFGRSLLAGGTVDEDGPPARS